MTTTNEKHLKVVLHQLNVLLMVGINAAATAREIGRIDLAEELEEECRKNLDTQDIVLEELWKLKGN